jgi:methylamine--corrinoid protein Co-methyltransferase
MCRLFAEVGIAATKLDRGKANEIVRALYEEYKDNLDLKKAPKGKSFNELYDLETLQPTPDHRKTYEEAKDKLTKIGLSL